VETILQAFPQSGELGDGVGLPAAERVTPFSEVAPKLTIAKNAPTEQRAKADRTRGLKAPD
jgi:hypothetical protein